MEANIGSGGTSNIGAFPEVHLEDLVVHVHRTRLLASYDGVMGRIANAASSVIDFISEVITTLYSVFAVYRLYVNPWLIVQNESLMSQNDTKNGKVSE